ncbi:hypothetical protein EJ074_20465 [Mesorhizobium sp. M3A.F.Ca.ET.080.04.2.1]|uniref:DUF6338 family protein n=1 Tax=Mesorhizobium sp. M3A.F.Ca.ET.080.04.2.1 TaxID=2493676 RepID=UPI000F762EA4|nr:DUF6338 family protein [Mesorhizobium sp. M3A.F.Ca.ET.080.04.2.1]AZO11196.1 hypothetical protein EJ074_20465 [Mesorhizobium sp. M3A.F.Ca.ET.080.04.2.1]RWF23793.1 MAG: hypothetical protein EOS64_10105 [Mesorhizobium sp.]
MTNLPDFAVDDLQKLATGLALLPGALILVVRSQFITGRRRPRTEEFFSYVLVTLLYLAVFAPLFGLAYSSGLTLPKIYAAWVVFILVGPFTLGLLFGMAFQYGWTAKALDVLGLEPVHTMPTAWDWKFGQRTEHWVVVKLKDDTCFYGYYGRRSFASSDEERDIYIEQVFLRGDQPDAKWVPTKNGLWVQASEISTIEFLDVDRQGE